MPSSDLNLLFGVLALQLNFITREALVSAMDEWILARDKPLGEFLQASGSLNAERRELLDALVQEHLRQHAGDVRQSLAAMSSIESVHDVLKEVADPELQASVALLPIGKQVRHEAETVIENAPLPQKLADGTVVRYFGEYEILDELGNGGMGIVYKVRQKKLGRILALKLIRAGELASSQAVQRFQTEAKAAASLTHPGIVSVHEVGVSSGQHFYTMDYVEGGSLSSLHRDSPVLARHAAEIVKQLAEAVQYSHENGIVHRDLKPGNVLLTANGIPRITDFGLAKRMWTMDKSVEESMTETGQILGTAGYMSPEQAAGKTRLVGPPADIYALGAVLYALLTSRAPFVGESQADTILQVIQKEPVPPRDVNPGIAHDLETICLKCLQKEPHKRYGTAQLLAEDLGRFLDGRPVVARPIGHAARAWSWCRRNPVVAGLTATVAVSMLIGTAVSLHFADQSRQRANANFDLARMERDARQAADRRKLEAERNATLAEKQRKEADANARLARRHLYCAHMGLAQKAWDEGRIGGVLSLLERHRADPGEEDLRGFEWHYWLRRCHSELADFRGHTSFVASVAFNSDGTRIVSASHDLTVRIWNTSSGALIHTLFGHSDAVRCAVFSPDGAKVASASWDRTVRLWDATTGQKLLTLEGHTGQIEGVAFSPDGATVASASHDGTIRLWDSTSGELRSSLDSHKAPATGVAFSPDGKWIVSAQGAAARVWNINNGTIHRILTGHTAAVMNVGFSPDGSTIATAGYDGIVKLWDMQSGRLTRSLTGHGSAVNWVAFSPDGRRIASASSDETIKIWNATSGQELITLKGRASAH